MGNCSSNSQKNHYFNLDAVEGGARVRCSSKLASDWINIILIGCAFAAGLIGLCLWMASDLSGFVVSRESSFWSWLVVIGGNVNFGATKVFVNLTWGLTGVLSFIIMFEAAIVVYEVQNRCVYRISIKNSKLMVFLFVHHISHSKMRMIYLLNRRKCRIYCLQEQFLLFLEKLF